MPRFVRSIGWAVVIVGFAPANFVTAAWALDCSKAKAPDEKAICADPQALAADDAMVKAYQALSASFSEAERKMLLASQREWLKNRAIACQNETGAAQSKCLKDQTDQRAQYLLGKPDAGPGSGGKLVPVIMQRPQNKAIYQLDVSALRYAPATTPAERLFNAAVDKILKKVPDKGENYQDGLTYSYEMSLSVTYASPKLISAHVSDYVFGGGAHGMASTQNINIDAAKGKIMSFDDIFPGTAEAKIDAECMRQILDDKKSRLEGEKIEGDDLANLRKGVTDGVKNLTQWSFAAGKATITYDAYAVGSYAEGPYTCELTADFLRPLVKAGFDLP